MLVGLKSTRALKVRSLVGEEGHVNSFHSQVLASAEIKRDLVSALRSPSSQSTPNSMVRHRLMVSVNLRTCCSFMLETNRLHLRHPSIQFVKLLGQHEYHLILREMIRVNCIDEDDDVLGMQTSPRVWPHFDQFFDT